METKVGSPPIVRSSPRSVRILSTEVPTSCRWATCAGVYGLVTRGSSWNRVTVLWNANSTSVGSVAPLIGEALLGCGVAASGMCPSPANNAEVGSSPIQPAPGTNTSAHACRSVKSSFGPPGPSSGSLSEVSWTR